MKTLKLLGISGSLRKESYNTKLLHLAAGMFGPSEFTFANIRFPLFDNDLQQSEGIPAEVQTLSDQIAAADAVIIASPEYNQSLPGVLKNALDWVSRTEGSPWKHKPVAIINAAAGRTGGARANYSLRLALRRSTRACCRGRRFWSQWPARNSMNTATWKTNAT